MTIVRILIALPFILWLGFMAIFGLGTAGIMSAVQGEDPGVLASTSGKIVTNVGLGALGMYANFKENQHVSAVFDPTTLTDNRTISFSAEVTLPDLLAPNEATPDKAYHLLYATARARSYMDQECTRLLDSIANRCVVPKVAVRDLKDGTYRLSTELFFAPSTPIGEARKDGDKEMGYQVLRSNLDLYGGDVEVAKDRLSDARDIFYTRAEEYCAALRQSVGNCVLETLQFSSRKKYGDDGIVIVTARAKFGMMSTAIAPKEDNVASLLDAMQKLKLN